MKEFEWTFGTNSFIDVKRATGCSSCAHFVYDDKLRVHVAWTTEMFTEREWDGILACIKQATVILKKLKRIRI